MTFEERLAEQGRRMDGMKAKLEKAVNAREEARRKNREELAAEIGKMNDAFDRFDAAVDAQIDKQVETLSAQIEKQYETLDRQAAKQIEDANAAAELAGEKLGQDVAKVKAAFTLDKAAVEALANEPTGIDLIEKGAAEQVARAKGDVAAAKENVRLIREDGDSKFDAARLRVQMRLNSAKQKVKDHREALDKAEQEEWILDLLDYAALCYEAACSYAEEGEYTLMEAAYELEYYKERFCKDE